MSEPENYPDAMLRLELERRLRYQQESISQTQLQGYREAVEKNRVTILDLEESVRAERAANESLAEELHLERQISAILDGEWISPAHCPPQLVPTIRAFIAEYHKAKAKHGEMTLDGTMAGDPATNDRLRLAALVEEVGEVAHEMTYDQADGVEWSDGAVEGRTEGGQLGRLMKELIQVMNVAGTWHSYLMPGAVLDKCYICGDPNDHGGLPHGVVTGDGFSRSDRDRGGVPRQTPAEGPVVAEGRVLPDDDIQAVSYELVAQAPVLPSVPGRFQATPAPRIIQVAEEGTTVLVPTDAVAVLVPREKLDAVVKTLREPS